MFGTGRVKDDFSPDRLSLFGKINSSDPLNL